MSLSIVRLESSAGIPAPASVLKLPAPAAPASVTAPVPTAAAPKEPPIVNEKFDAAMKKGDLLELAALVAEAGDDKAKAALLEKRDKNGDTALLRAVRSGDAPTAAMLAYLGARVGATDDKGLTPAFLAASKDDAVTVEALLGPKYAARLNAGLRYPPEVIAEGVKKIASGSFDAKALDRFAAALTGESVDAFAKAVPLQKYITHLEEMDDNPLGVEAKGWLSHAFLPMRIRSLIEMAVAPDVIAAETKQTPEAVRLALCTEIAVEIETLRLRHRDVALAQLSDRMLRMRLAANAAAGLAQRLEGLPAGFELSIPGGWAGHAIYLSFAARKIDGQDVITFRVDNRGAGRHKHEKAENENYGFPLVVNIPADKLGEPSTRAAVEAVLREQLLLKGDATVKAPGEALYAAFNKLRARLISEHGPLTVKDGPKAEPAQPMQTTGNCVVANHDSGLLRRLGPELGEAVRGFEKRLAQGRLFEVLTPATLRAAIDANRLRVKSELEKKPAKRP